MSRGRKGVPSHHGVVGQEDRPCIRPFHAQTFDVSERDASEHVTRKQDVCIPMDMGTDQRVVQLRRKTRVRWISMERIEVARDEHRTTRELTLHQFLVNMRKKKDRITLSQWIF